MVGVDEVAEVAEVAEVPKHFQFSICLFLIFFYINSFKKNDPLHPLTPEGSSIRPETPLSGSFRPPLLPHTGSYYHSMGGSLDMKGVKT